MLFLRNAFLFAPVCLLPTAVMRHFSKNRCHRTSHAFYCSSKERNLSFDHRISQLKSRTGIDCSLNNQTMCPFKLTNQIRFFCAGIFQRLRVMSEYNKDKDRPFSLTTIEFYVDYNCFSFQVPSEYSVLHRSYASKNYS